MNLLPTPGYNGNMVAKKPGRRMTKHGFTAILEAMELQNRATIEAVTSQVSRVDQRIETLERNLTIRIQALEIAVRQNSEDIRKNSEDIRKNSEDIRKNSEDIRKNSEDIQRLKEQLAELTGVVQGKVDARNFASLESRVAKLEARLGI